MFTDKKLIIFETFFLYCLICCLYALPVAYAFGRSFSNPLLLLWIPVSYFLFHFVRRSIPLKSLFEEKGLYFLLFLWVPALIDLGPSEAWRNGKTFLCGLVVMAAMLEQTRENERFVKGFLIVLVSLGIFLGADSLYQWLHGTDILGIKKAMSLGGSRATATFSHPNYLGFVLSGALPLALLLIHRFESLLFFSLGCISALFSLIGIFLSGSRSSWIATFITLGVLAPLFFKREKRWHLGILAGISAVTVLALANEVILRRFNRAIRAEDPRLSLWKDSLEIISQAPVLGHGIGVWKLHPKWAAVTFPHNFLLEIAAECGMLALAVFFYCVYRIVKVYLLRLWNDETGRFYLCAVVATFVAAVINIPFFSRHVGTFFWQCLGLAIGFSFRVASRKGDALFVKK